MSIRKRVKINVQSSAEADAAIDAKKLNRARLSLFRDDDDDEDDLKDVPTRVLKKKKDQQSSEIAAPEDSQTNYNDLFSKSPKPSFERVLNLEDMAEEDDQEVTAIAGQQRTNIRHNRNQDDEKIYVSLLDKEDKIEIMDTMKRLGGTDEEQDELGEHEFDLLDDGKLPLSSRELLLSRSRKKQAIEEAIRMQDEEGSATWEKRMLSKAGHVSIVELPRLYSSDDEADTVSQAIASIALRKSQLEKQLKALKAQKADLQQQQATLTHRLAQWPQIKSE